MSRVLAQRYRLGPQIGVGGMGCVYAAQDLVTGITVAVKVLHRRPVTDEIWRVFEALEHPNVVRVLAHGRDNGHSFVVMERLHGAPLGERIRRSGALSFARVLHIGTQLLAGLGALHDAGLAHGDVKSDNVMVDEQAGDRVRLIDVGIARRGPEDHTFTGTPEYVAPEVISGAQPTVASDLYGVGVILYEMVAATTPFGGGDPEDIFERHLIEPPAPLAVRCPERNVPDAFQALIERVLAKDPASRPASSAEVSSALRRALPAAYEDSAPQLLRFSTSSPTLDWSRPTIEATSTWHRHK